jgi:hypothetical protein
VHCVNQQSGIFLRLIHIVRNRDRGLWISRCQREPFGQPSKDRRAITAWNG